jgi:hypothetical protein
MSDAATYVYCLVSAARRPALSRSRGGLAGTGPLRLLELERRTWLVVTDAPLAIYGSKTVNEKLSDLDWVSRVAVQHEAVVESFTNARAVVPMKLFTMFASDDRAREYMAREGRRIAAVVRRVSGRVEWGVRVVLDRERATTSTRARSRKQTHSSAASGAAYLSQKKAQRDFAAELSERARTVVADLYDRLAATASIARRRSAGELPVQGGPLLLDAAFLVGHRRSSAFRKLVDRHARALAADGYRVTLSGPWPPYSFVQE